MPLRTRRTTMLTASAAALGGSLLLAGCGAAPEAGGPGASEGSDFTACAVSGAGGWNDKSFNEQVYEGLQTAESELGVRVIPFESMTLDDFAPGLESLVDEGCNLIFGIGFDANDAVNAAAAANPEIDFVTVDGFVVDESTTNLKPVTYAMSESAFLGGYLAAGYSETHTVGTFGAIQNTAITDFMTGFYNGAQQWAEDNGTPTEVLGWDPASETGVFVGDFANQISAKSISEAQLNQGADVLFPVAGPLFAAAGEAIRDTGRDAVFLGVDSDVAVTSPDYADIVLTSVEKRMAGAVVEIIDQAQRGEFSPEPYVGTLENEGTGLSAFHDFASSVTPELQTRLDELTAEIVAGTIDTLG